MGKVTYVIDHYMYIPKALKAQLSPCLPFKELRVAEVRGGGGGGKRLGAGGEERIFFYLKREGGN